MILELINRIGFLQAREIRERRRKLRWFRKEFPHMVEYVSKREGILDDNARLDVWNTIHHYRKLYKKAEESDRAGITYRDANPRVNEEIEKNITKIEEMLRRSN